MFLLLSISFANDPPPPIVGGSVTNSFLQVGAIAALDSNGYGAAFCSGTLIDDTWIVTAAHCIEGNDAAVLMLRVHDLSGHRNLAPHDGGRLKIHCNKPLLG